MVANILEFFMKIILVAFYWLFVTVILSVKIVLSIFIQTIGEKLKLKTKLKTQI